MHLAEQQRNCGGHEALWRSGFPSIAAEKTGPGDAFVGRAALFLLLSTDPAQVEAAQRLRYDVFSSEPGFALTGQGDGSTSTASTSTVTTCWCARTTPVSWWVAIRMLSPTGAIEAGGLYTQRNSTPSAGFARPSLVEMGRAVVHNDHRHGLSYF